MKFLIATHNQKKKAELQRILQPLNIEVNTADDLKINLSDVEETGITFEENALLKARSGCLESGLPTIGDDSGLEVQALNGEPGIFSARYAGKNATDKENMDKLLYKLSGVALSKRQARFVCSLALVFPDGKTFLEQGILDGIIMLKPRGVKGFGYDPIFFVPELNKTLSQISQDEKNRISHRGKALEKIKKYLINMKVV